MKTFKLKSFSILENNENKMAEKIFDFIDGLIVNREDDVQHSWLVEIYLNRDEESYFKQLKESQAEVFLKVKITKETNEPATLITTCIGLNELGGEMNVLFMGGMVDARNQKTEQTLASLIEEGYEGEELLEKFKALL